MNQNQLNEPLHQDGDKVVSLEVGTDWLKSKSKEEYRAYLHQAFVKAQCNFQMRKSKTNEERQKYEKQAREIENQNPNNQKIKENKNVYVTLNPDVPNIHSDKLKLLKLSRSCSKKMLERYFHFDNTNENFVYYKKQTDQKPQKQISIAECKFNVEKKLYYEGLSEDQKTPINKWVDEDKPFRVSMKFKSRKFQPIYYYTNSLHEAVCIKAIIERMMNPNTQMIKNQIERACIIFRMNCLSKFTKALKLIRVQRLQFAKMVQQLYVIQDHCQVARREMMDFAFYEEKKEEEPSFDQIEEIKEPESIIHEPEPERIPQIWSTLKFGQVMRLNYFNFKNYSKIARLGQALSQFVKNRRNDRHPMIQDMITKKVETKSFAIDAGKYYIDDAILDNMHKLGDIPFLVSDINDIATIRIENDNLIINDKRKHEYHLPISEICFIATDIQYKQQQQQQQRYRLQLRGRKINQNVAMMGENIFSQQIGLERQKVSRLQQKSIIKFSLKKLYIPIDIQEQMQNLVVNEKDKVLYRIKLDIGEFHCHTPAFVNTKSNSTIIELKEDLNIDIHDNKYIKITLISIKGRTQPHNQMPNEFVNEQIVAYVNLRLKDFEDGKHELLHNITFNQSFYDQSKQPHVLDGDNVILQAAIVVQNVNGAYPTLELEGNQLLIGRYAIYKQQILCKILSVNRDNTCSILISDTQPNSEEFQQKLIHKVSIKQDIILIERQGISIFNLDSQPQNYAHGQFEWGMDLQISQNQELFLSRLYDMILAHQLKLIYQQRIYGCIKTQRSQAFVCGMLFISIMGAQNLQNSNKKSLCDSFVQLEVSESKNFQNSKFIDIANEQSFIECKENSEIAQNQKYKTTEIKQNNNPSWVTNENPHGEVFDLGMFMKKYPHHILIQIYHRRKKKGMFTKEMEEEMIGYAELNTEDLISLDNYGQELYLYLEDSVNKNTLIKIRTLFVPTSGTIERMNLNPDRSIFKNTQQFLFFKVLNMTHIIDEYGYQVPIGSYLADFKYHETLIAPTPNKQDLNSSLIIEGAQFQERYEKFSPEHKRHAELKDLQPLRPKYEENVFMFRQFWQYSQHQTKNVALTNRQRLFWEEFMNDLMVSAEDQDFVDDEMKSIRTKFSGTTKLISSKYKKRNAMKKSNTAAAAGGNSARGQPNMFEEEKDSGKKASVVFIGQWEKQNSWKYVDIWYLVKFGIPPDLRVSLWKDLLRKSINEQQAFVYFKNNAEYQPLYNKNMSVYQNIKVFANARDSLFYQQIEQDLIDYTHPEGYLKNQASTRDDRLEEERFQIYQVLKCFGLYANEISGRREKVLTYNNGIISILQRFLSFMPEEDAFWMLVGMAKAFNNLLNYDYREPKTSKLDQYALFCPYVNRKISFKNEMIILLVILKVHFPLVFEHLKSLSVPLEWYFYDYFISFYSTTFSSDLVMRVWDMMMLNLSTNQIDQRKRALWYLLAIPIYMVQVNNEQILRTQNPIKIKEILHLNTASLNYNPNIFVDELLKIVKSVFVKKDGLVSKLMKNDKPYQLENMRIEIEDDFARKHRENQIKSQEIAKFIEDRGINIQINSKKLYNSNSNVNNDMFLVNLKIVALRNILPTTLENELASLQIVLNCDEQVVSPVFMLQMPSNNEISLFQQLSEPMEMKTQIMGNIDQKRIKIQVYQIEDGIHQSLLGTGNVKISDFNNIVEQYASIKVFGRTENQNAYVDFKIQVLSRNRSHISKTYSQGFYGVDQNDYFSILKDSETMKGLKTQAQQQKLTNLQQLQESINKPEPAKLIESLQKQVIDMKISQNDYEYALQQLSVNELSILQAQFETDRKFINGLRHIESLMNVSENMIQTLNLGDHLEVNYSQTALKFLLHGGGLPSTHIIESLYFIYERSNIQDLAKVIYNLFSVCQYPLPFNEILQLLRMSLFKQYSYITRVTQQQSIEPVTETNFFAKMLSDNPTKVQVFDITEAFRNTLNSVIRVTGYSQEIDMRQEPYNNLNFWFGGQQNNVKKGNQIICVSMNDNNGDQILFRFKFNSYTGAFLDLPGFSQILPIQVNGKPTLNRNEFTRIINKNFPMISNFMRQDIFLRDQLFGSQEVYLPAKQPYRFVFQHLSKKFIFRFSKDIESTDDFTVDNSQLMRLAKGDVSQIYRRQFIGSEEVIDAQLSSVSMQDTFISIKNRIKMMLEFITQSENLSDVPNVLSEKFQFKKYGLLQDDESPYYHSMTRLNNAMQQKDNTFELVRVLQAKEDEASQYSSYALYQHPNGFNEWRPCKILFKLPGAKGGDEKYKVEFLHEKEAKHSYQYNREDVLLSFDYKRNQENYQQEEIQEFLDKLDKDEVQIAHMLKFQDDKVIDEIMRQQDPGENEGGLRIQAMDLDEEKDEEFIYARNHNDDDDNQLWVMGN